MDGDKRANPRFLYSEPVSYGLPEVTVNGSIARNISLSGISLKAQGFVPLGTVLELQIRPQDSPKIIWARAKVVRIRQLFSEDCYEIGLEFIRDKETMRAVGRLIGAGLNQQVK
ncbi:MAG: PilZ domain-containing protein [Candidatus Omnitrophica bacterium]|nr:PilZ domain-containing protein [Candidatus Omnitrophota bacterium]MDE2008975.1 PilZ domain-containing protein [Candidatus Omnitrophota bacterium]MDE2214499.1 PilZ domain-containing protein [Candidatus Omnitrophota bacterium]MDE2230817.1 PilZ domain-containing protein [Candidatus Omnitrophota bacterium]